MFALAAPLVLLYLMAGSIALLNDKRRDKKFQASLLSDSL
jgi:sec-independent protein translocase protein TatC